MSCDPLLNKYGKCNGWVCSRSKKPQQQCYICGRPATKLCDFEQGTGTCDKPMCRKHSHHTCKNTDYCEEHYKTINQAQTLLFT